MVKIQCERCGKEFEQVQKTQRFCSRKCKDGRRWGHLETRICKNCGKEFQGNIITDYCSNECKNTGWVANLKKSMKETYGVENALQSEELKQKQQQTCLEKYGETNVSRVEEFKKKRRATTFKHLGYEYSTQSPEIQAKMKETIRKNHGVDYPFQSKEIRDRALETTKLNTGGLYLFQTEEFKEKNIEHNMKTHGVPYHCMAEECTRASKKDSNINKKVQKLFEDNGLKIDYIDFPLSTFQYDIKVGNNLIEINPSVSHYTNSAHEMRYKPKDKNYHKIKTIVARENGYRCIMVWDWDDINKVIWLLKPKETVYARKCEIKQIAYDDAHQLFTKFHLQGDTAKNKNNIYIGLYYNDELVECMSFGKPRNNGKYEWEILRLCTHGEYNIIGGASKIFKYFLDISGASSVISYCDMCKFDGKVYEQLGFKLLRKNAPSRHWWFDGKKSIGCPLHLTDGLIRQKSFDGVIGKFFGTFGKGTNNEKNMREAGYIEIYDAGQATYVRNKKGEK